MNQSYILAKEIREHRIDVKETKQDCEFVGWREEVSLPDFKLKNLKAKIDTGAKTSALHADNIEIVSVKGKKFVKFTFTSESGEHHTIKSPFIVERSIRSSNGDKTIRPVVKTEIKMGKHCFDIEVTLINRGMMGFKMLIGREALIGRFLINPAKHNLLKPKKES
ncbi:MAG: hypothetical protein HOP07_01990 [Bacteriovoracaceae bacterium]|nr:hypothetical protein [Bacteriovoracaceae bacterium]